MATVRVYAPVKDFDGEVAGVRFEKGVAEVEPGSAAYRYFRTAGYGIDRAAERDVPDAVDPTTIGTDGDGITPVGTRLRDAAVDPQPGDFLPPTNAGQANPHGPEVVSPGLHATPPAPIAPGPVPRDPAEQEAKETALAEAVLVDQQPVPEAVADVDTRTDTEREADEQAARGSDRTYEGSGLEQLRAELRRRGLPVSGNKPDLVKRLREHDAQTGNEPSTALDSTGEST